MAQNNKAVQTPKATPAGSFSMRMGSTTYIIGVASTTPYGYLKDKDDPNVWIVDEEAAVVVRRIFHMTMDGYGPYQIARALKED